MVFSSNTTRVNVSLVACILSLVGVLMLSGCGSGQVSESSSSSISSNSATTSSTVSRSSSSDSTSDSPTNDQGFVTFAAMMSSQPEKLQSLLLDNAYKVSSASGSTGSADTFTLFDPSGTVREQLSFLKPTETSSGNPVDISTGNESAYMQISVAGGLYSSLDRCLLDNGVSCEAGDIFDFGNGKIIAVTFTAPDGEVWAVFGGSNEVGEMSFQLLSDAYVKDCTDKNYVVALGAKSAQEFIDIWKSEVQGSSDKVLKD